MNCISSSNLTEAISYKMKEETEQMIMYSNKEIYLQEQSISSFEKQGRRIIIQDQVFDYFVIFQVQTFVLSIFCTLLADQNIPSFPLNAF